MTTYTIPINQTIANKIGLEPALVLQQIKYWIEKCGRTLQGEEGAWIYNSYEEWHEQFSYWSLSKIRRVLKFLEDKGFIKSKKANAKKWNHTKWYSINFAKFNLLLGNIKSPVKKIYSKVTNRSVQNEQIIERQENNYTNKTLFKSLSFKKQETKIVEKIEEREKNKMPKEEEGGIANKLIAIWEAGIPSKGKEIVLTKARENRFKAIFHKHFNSDFKQWEKFIADIKKSKFLMGERTGFRISLDWAIREENLLKIQEGNYLAKDEIESERKNEAISKLESNSISDPRWKNMLQSLFKKFGQDTYVSWFSKMELDAMENGVLKIKTQSGFVRDYLENNHGRMLQRIGEQYFEGLRKICFITS